MKDPLPVVPEVANTSETTGSWRRFLGVVLGTIISIVCLVLVLREINFGEVGNVLRQADARLLLIALFMALVNYVALAVRWGLLFFPHHRPGFKYLFGAQVVAQLVNTVFPGRLSPLARVGWLSSHTGISKTFVLSTIVIEKILDGVLYFLILLIVVATMPLPMWVRDAGMLTSVVPLVLAGLLFGFIRIKPRVSDFMYQVADGVPVVNRLRIISTVQSALESLDIWRYPTQRFLVLGWSGGVWTATVLLNYVTLRALHLHMPFMASLVVLVFVQASLRVPASPGSVGVFHYASVLALGMFSVDRDVALGYAIVLHLLNFLPQSLLGILYLWQARARFGSWFPNQVFIVSDQQSSETTF